ncbi:hypothetical protein BUALT_Bualt12G0080400 [Buddleja alternifolia]|uniref:Reverse transcriptase domain-containing protein n=1 Tax=Buddleja alternifolia TaxID=168488 RepID=A0AAV6WPR4_9LAMI|nr:hypothetical protein BUALT_Bualt12G0080400 [Buddleja alternifolia]
MSDLVLPLQSSFIPGMSTHDNVLVIQELIHSLRKSKGRVGGMVIKLDLEKAYDKVNWEFLEQTLDFFGFPPNLVRLIMFCVTNSKPRVLWNGEPLTPFVPSCGLRQGDPLSTYLFVLCVERLGYLVEHEVNEGKWDPLPVCRGGPRFSHLFFADDLLFMAKATKENATTINSILEKFCGSLGLLVNKAKSQIFFSKNTDRGIRRCISGLLGFGCTNDLGKYLGAPLVHNRVSSNLYNELIDRVQSRLTTWKAKMLNIAERTALIQSVTPAMPSYIMQSSWISTAVCNRLDKLNRVFFVGIRWELS